MPNQDPASTRSELEAIIVHSIRKHSQRRPDTRSISDITRDLIHREWADVRDAIQNLQDQGVVGRRPHRLGSGWVILEAENLPPQTTDVSTEISAGAREPDNSQACGEVRHGGAKGPKAQATAPFWGAFDALVQETTHSTLTMHLCIEEDGVSHPTTTKEHAGRHATQRPSSPGLDAGVGMERTARTLVGRSVVRAPRHRAKPPTYSPDSAMGLALYFEERVEPIGLPWPTNRNALASAFSAWKKSGTRPEVIREAITMFTTEMDWLKLRNAKTSAWRMFLSEREPLLQRARDNVSVQNRSLDASGWVW
jgi:hypothetical protein